MGCLQHLLLFSNGFRDYHFWTILHRKGVSGNESYERISEVLWGRRYLVVKSRLWGRRFQIRNPIPLKIRRVWGLLHAKSYVVVKRPPVGVVRKFGERVAAQVSSSSSDMVQIYEVRP
ncbi:hypothetical protein AVEN_113329-1 [Araneus ventricosus]|uniref:Uncharacterized protein n=1 Tax=Araneus ventricosus TaxID=182803 RepID=A0A4Y2HA54_ARAVE|nr:hypothetical protein AVEN_113329-1 [Araneus ventricosus]